MLSRLILVTAFAVLLTALVEGSTDLATARQPKPFITLGHIHRRLVELSHHKRKETFSNSTSLDKLFSGVTLYKFETEASKNFTDADGPSKDTKSGGKSVTIRDEEAKQELQTSASIEIVCKRCYTKGKAMATLRIDEAINATQALHEVENSVSNTMHQIADWVDDIDFHISEFELDIPAPNITFDVDMPAFPGTTLEFQFDGVEIFVELDIMLSAGLNYRLNLYKSKELGIELADDLFLGLIFSIDLILTVESEITITSGFHILLDDGVLLKLALFAKETSDIEFNGGKFEFLPVSVKAGGAVLRGVIQLSLRSGFSLATPDLTPGFDIEVGDFSLDDFTTATAGIEARVYANVAELVTNVTANTDEASDCALEVVQEYTFAVGVAAGATAGIGGHIWGPVGATEVPLFSTTLANVCAIGAAAATPSATLTGRAAEDDNSLTTTTLTREQTFSAMQCASTGLVECPASLLTVHENIRTETLVTAVPSGSKASFPEPANDQVISTIAFGINAKDMVSETPTPTPTSQPSGDDNENDDSTTDRIKDVVDGNTNGVNNKLIIGLSVGLGVPAILAAIAAFVIWRRRRNTIRYAPAATTVDPTDGAYIRVGEAKEATQEVYPLYDRS